MWNTKTEVVNGETQVTFFDTDIVRFRDNQVRLNSGGYRTQATLRRMNWVSESFGLGLRVVQVCGDWFVRADWLDRTLEFRDNMVIERPDVETFEKRRGNNRVEMERKIHKLIERKGKGNVR